jgi:iron complex outermembrane receptor protein
VLNCLLTNDPATCGLVTRVNGELIEVEGFLQNIAAIKTNGIDVNLAYRGWRPGIGRFGFTWNNTFLRNYDVIVPGPTGPQLLSREGTQVGSPSQAFPKYKSVGVVDLDWTDFGVTVIGRYVSKLEEVGGNVMDSVFYTDLQLRFIGRARTTSSASRSASTTCSTRRRPGCVTCEANNFSQTVTTFPGRYFYARASFRQPGGGGAGARTDHADAQPAAVGGCQVGGNGAGVERPADAPPAADGRRTRSPAHGDAVVAGGAASLELR